MRLKHTQNGLKNIILLNLIVFTVQFFMEMLFPSMASPFIRLFALIPRDFMKGHIWQGITYMFLHGGIFHLLINMYILWMFGKELEYLWGTREFCKYYFICGIGAALIYSLFNSKSVIPVIGASGAVFGILIAFGVTFPRTKLIIFPFLIPLDAKYAVWIFGILEFVYLFERKGNIAHLAHLGGLVVGYLYLRWKRRKLY
ncbi:MAG: rhomboid family intramembrane serine protease [candidate division WOR-3 bacterium]